MLQIMISAKRHSHECLLYFALLFIICVIYKLLRVCSLREDTYIYFGMQTNQGLLWRTHWDTRAIRPGNMVCTSVPNSLGYPLCSYIPSPRPGIYTSCFWSRTAKLHITASRKLSPRRKTVVLRGVTRIES